MTAAADQPASSPAFSPKVILALVLVGLVAAAGLAVLSAFAPDLRSGNDGRAHALSKSAVGFAGAPILMKGMGVSTVVSRTRPTGLQEAVVILTPEGNEKPEALRPFAEADLVLIVLPKWLPAPDPVRRGYVRKMGVVQGKYDELFKTYAKATQVRTAPELKKGARAPRYDLRGVADLEGMAMRTGAIDRLQTASGAGWVPILVDSAGRAVMLRSAKHANVWLLAEPDLLNNHGLGSRDTANAGAAILMAASVDGELPLVFDVTLNGYERGRGIWRTMLEPPWLAATLIGAMAGVLMGVHALARFGQPRRRERAFALGAQALVDNSADLVRMAKREHELAPAYAALTRGLVVRAGGGHTAEEHWLEHLAERRGATAPSELAAEAETAKSRDDLLSIARKLYDWRGEMTRERR